MSEYIKREPLLLIAKQLEGSCFATPRIIDAIKKAPTADVVEVRHGEWIVDNRTFSVMDKFGYVREEHKKTHTCSECRVGIVGLANMKYCPNCGAKMDGEMGED